MDRLHTRFLRVARRTPLRFVRLVSTAGAALVSAAAACSDSGGVLGHGNDIFDSAAPEAAGDNGGG